jgi:hypothetical protein
MTKLAPALVAVLGGQATPEECALITEPLRISGASDLTGIEQFANVDAVELLGCDLAALDDIAKMPKLRTLRVLCTSLRDLAALRRCETLVELELNYTLVEDLSPLLELPSLHWLRLFGNPLSRDSYDELLPKIAQRVMALWRKPPIVEVSPRSEWEVARKIRDAGLPIAFGALPRTGVVNIVKPGRGGEGRVVDFLEAGFEFVDKVVREDPKFADHDMFHDFSKQDWVDPSPSRFRVQWLAGNHRDAYDWVDKSVTDGGDREAFFKFISRFNRELFYVDSAEAVVAHEKTHRVQLPEWFKSLRHRTLAGVRPSERKVLFRFGSFESESITRKEGLYRIGLCGYYNPEDRSVFLDRCGMFPVGDIATPRDLGNSMLAINLRKPDDRRIYEFWPRSLYNAMEEGANPSELIVPVFSNWSSLLLHVTEIVVGDEVVPAAL